MSFPQIAALAALALAASVLIPAAQAGERAGIFTFTVTRDGEPIGGYQVAFSHDGERTEIKSEMELEVSFGMLPLYRFSNLRHEVWQDGRPVRISSRTDDNGEQLDITLRPDGTGYVRTVNDRVDRFDASAKVLAMWNRNTVEAEPGLFVSVIEDQALELAFAPLGRETVIVEGREVAVDHYRMSGDEERDIWYDTAGQVARVRFERDGAAIEYHRNEFRARPLDGRFARR